MAHRLTWKITLHSKLQEHDNFQNSNAFIEGGGQRGPQKDILLPGTYYINPLMFKVIPESAKEVRPSEVAVIVSNVGKTRRKKFVKQWLAKFVNVWNVKREQITIAAENSIRLMAMTLRLMK